MNLTTPLQRPDATCPVWLWALLPLLLAGALTIPLLNDDAFTGDEPKTLFVAGVLSSGPHTLAGVVDALAVRSPEQALGWPILVFIWGRIAGWSEPAIRILPFLAGMLALALVARAGRDLMSAAAGVIAALLLAGSAFFLTYMFHARAFTTVALCATLCVWCYWRIALRPESTGPGSAGRPVAGRSRLAVPALCRLADLASPGPVSSALRTRRIGAGGGRSSCSGWPPLQPRRSSRYSSWDSVKQSPMKDCTIGPWVRQNC